MIPAMFDFNVLRAPEIHVLIDAIRAMVFRVHRNQRVLYFQFENRVVFKLDELKRTLSMFDRSQENLTVVFTFSRFRWTHWYMWWRLKRAVAWHDQVVSKVHMQNYRAMFGSLMADLIGELGNIMEVAEAEAAELARLDGTNGGTKYHPEIQRILQIDTAPPPPPPTLPPETQKQ